MKALASTLLVLLLAIPLRADDSDNLIQNGDFSSGIDHWYGGGRSPADYASDNPLDSTNPLVSKGLIMPLHPETWTKVAQDFRANVTSGLLTIMYTTSPDFAFSTKAEDYQNITGKLNYDGWKPLNTPAGSWLVLLNELGRNEFIYWEVAPKAGAGVQTYHAKITNMTPGQDETLTLAFPPGTGLLVVLSVTLTSGQAAPQ